MEELRGKIGDYMSSPPLSVDVGVTVQEAARFMRDQNVGAVFVTDQKGYVGMVSETDLAQKVVARGINPDTTKVEKAMSRGIISMDRHRAIEEAGEFMCKNKVRFIAVTENDKIVGMLSVKNLFSYCAKTYHLVA